MGVPIGLPGSETPAPLHLGGDQLQRAAADQHLLAERVTLRFGPRLGRSRHPCPLPLLADAGASAVDSRRGSGRSRPRGDRAWWIPTSDASVPAGQTLRRRCGERNRCWDVRGCGRSDTVSHHTSGDVPARVEEAQLWRSRGVRTGPLTRPIGGGGVQHGRGGRRGTAALGEGASGNRRDGYGGLGTRAAARQSGAGGADAAPARRRVGLAGRAGRLRRRWDVLLRRPELSRTRPARAGRRLVAGRDERCRAGTGPLARASGGGDRPAGRVVLRSAGSPRARRSRGDRPAGGTGPSGATGDRHRDRPAALPRLGTRPARRRARRSRARCSGPAVRRDPAVRGIGRQRRPADSPTCPDLLGAGLRRSGLLRPGGGRPGRGGGARGDDRDGALAGFVDLARLGGRLPPGDLHLGRRRYAGRPGRDRAAQRPAGRAAARPRTTRRDPLAGAAGGSPPLRCRGWRTCSARSCLPAGTPPPCGRSPGSVHGGRKGCRGAWRARRGDRRRFRARGPRPFRSAGRSGRRGTPKARRVGTR